MAFKCSNCGKNFASKFSLERHIASQHENSDEETPADVSDTEDEKEHDKNDPSNLFSTHPIMI